MSKIGQALWIEIADELEWHLRKRGDIQIDQQDVRDVAASMADGILGVVLRFENIEDYLKRQTRR